MEAWAVGSLISQ